MREHCTSGYLDTGRTLRHRDWLAVARSDAGLSVHDIHQWTINPRRGVTGMIRQCRVRDAWY
jgi:hypothetical protein